MTNHAAGLILVWLLVMHALCDYPLQGDFLARAKRRGGIPGVPWFHALTAHALIQAGGVLLVTGSFVLFVLELIAHWAIDYWKCSVGAFGSEAQEEAYDIDQALHVNCKLLWCWVMLMGWV